MTKGNRAAIAFECAAFFFIFSTMFQCVHYPIKGHPDWWQIHWMSEIGVVFLFPSAIIVSLFADFDFLTSDIYSLCFVMISAAIHVTVIHFALAKMLKRLRQFKQMKSGASTA